MSIETTVSSDGQTLTIRIVGRFDFNNHRDFRIAYEGSENKQPSPIAIKHYILDFFQTEYLDSSALGMLLLLRDFAGGDKADVKIVNCPPDVFDVLNVARFHKLFSINNSSSS